jgi:chromosome segregation ATPase
MKLFLPIVLAVVSIVLAISLYTSKQDASAQHQTDAGAIADLSNQLTSAQSQISDRGETIVTLSNSLDQCQSASVTLSNQLADAKTEAAADKEQIGSLNAKMTEMQAGDQALVRQTQELTNQINGLAQNLATAKSSLTETNQALTQTWKEYLLLENRFRIDVGERVLVERKFRNIAELKTQMRRLKENPFGEIYPELIYANLDVEVKSNGTFHVVAPN